MLGIPRPRPASVESQALGAGALGRAGSPVPCSDPARRGQKGLDKDLPWREIKDAQVPIRPPSPPLPALPLQGAGPSRGCCGRSKASPWLATARVLGPHRPRDILDMPALLYVSP